MKRGRGNRALSPTDIADVRALVAKGYWRKSIAALFDVHVSTVYKALAEPHALPELAVMPRRPHPLTWAQRVIWASGGY